MSEIQFKCHACGAEIEADESLGGGLSKCPACGSGLMVPAPGIHKGLEISGFKIESLLGAGGMGEVWLATQKMMDRKVALKILSPALTNNTEFVSRFFEEVRNTAKLGHPNIITAFDAGVDKGYYYMAVSYVDGATLDDLLKIDKIFDEKKALGIIRETASALGYAWDKFRILHRDIKPANIMIDRSGRAMLMDLGISKSAAEKTNITMTGVIIGTPYYMSPEQAKAEKDIDFRADLYSLGATLYQMVAGDVPYNGETAISIITKHIVEPLPPAREKNPAVSEQCAALIEIMMAKDKNDRHKSWDELTGDIDRVLEGEFPRGGPGGAVKISAPAPRGVTASKRGLPRIDTPARTPLRAGMAGAEAAGTAPEILEEKEQRGLLFRITAAGLCLLVVSLTGLAAWLLISRDGKTADSAAPAAGENITAAPRLSGADSSSPEQSPAPKESPSKSAGGEALWKAALEFSRERGGDYDLRIEKFMELKAALAGTEYEKLADAEIQKAAGEKMEAVKEVFQRLSEKASGLVKAGQFEEAASLMEQYSGPWDKETRESRMKAANTILREAGKSAKAKEEFQKEARKHYNEIMGAVAGLLAAGQRGHAAELAAKAKTVNFPEAEQKSIDAAIKLIGESSGAEDAIAESFRKETGKSVTFQTNKGPQTGVIKEVRDNGVWLTGNTGASKISSKVSFDSLSLSEKTARTEIMPAAARAVYLGAAAAREKKYPLAMKYFMGAGELSEYLSDALKSVQARDAGDASPPAPPASPPPEKPSRSETAMKINPNDLKINIAENDKVSRNRPGAKKIRFDEQESPERFQELVLKATVINQTKQELKNWRLRLAVISTISTRRGDSFFRAAKVFTIPLSLKDKAIQRKDLEPVVFKFFESPDGKNSAGEKYAGYTLTVLDENGAVVFTRPGNPKLAKIAESSPEINEGDVLLPTGGKIDGPLIQKIIERFQL
jgi:serine/threonine-protein kinase